MRTLIRIANLWKGFNVAESLVIITGIAIVVFPFVNLLFGFAVAELVSSFIFSIGLVSAVVSESAYLILLIKTYK